uniref:WD repeat domain 70 n=1 Tax=Ovis aries TaxID=9940 RepID=A0AC11DFD3_SHEEP
MERPGPSDGSDVSGPDPQLAVTMGFTGFGYCKLLNIVLCNIQWVLVGKKARTFDLEAMFEQTRRTAVERSRKTLVEPVFGRLSERWLSELCTPLIVDPDSIEN